MLFLNDSANVCILHLQTHHDGDCLLLRPLSVRGRPRSDQRECGSCTNKREPHLRVHRGSHSPTYRTRLEHRKVTMIITYTECTGRCEIFKVLTPRQGFLPTIQIFRASQSGPATISRHESILHFQLLFGSLPISLDLIELHRLERTGTVETEILLSNAVFIHLLNVFGRHTYTPYTTN